MLSPQELWAKLGGPGEAPARVGRHAGALLVLGGAACVWADYARVRPWSGDILAVNDIGSHLHDRIAYWATLHPEYLPGWLDYRRRHCFGEGHLPLTFSHRAHPSVAHAWDLPVAAGGTSGLYGALVGLLLGYERVVLAGVPMDGTPHYFDPPADVIAGYGTDTLDRAVAMQWEQARDLFFAGRVTSLSGRTADWLGPPVICDRQNQMNAPKREVS